MRNVALPLLLLASASATAQDQNLRIPEYLSAKCQDLAVVTYWSATSHLSQTDEGKAAQAVKDATEATQLRPGIDPALIKEAEKWGRISHGNAGAGNTDLDSARGDAVLSAIGTYEMCIEGKLAGDDKVEKWWDR